MKDPNLKVREALYTVINGNVTSGGELVPMYDEMAADSAGYPRIVVTTQDSVDWSNLTKYGHEHDITFEIVDSDRLGKKRIDEIAKQLKPLLFANLDLSPDFASAVATLGSDFTYKLPTEDGVGQIIREITLKLYITEV